MLIATCQKHAGIVKLLLDAGAEVIIDTATHYARCFLPTSRWVIIGTNSIDERRHAEIGVDGQLSISVEGPPQRKRG